MKVSLNWLRELVELPASVPALVDLLTLAGIEVEGEETRGVNIDHVVVAQIQESVQHPNADRLSVCQVDDGSGTARQIVCGAKNYKVGDKVPLALPGAVLPGDFKIKVGKLRGVESQGMLCSAKELNLAEDADGLLLLAPDSAVGASLGTLFPADTVLDLEITPNRPDLLSNVGIAKEIAALTGRSLHAQSELPEPPIAGPSPEVAISANAPCFYTARRVAGVTVGPSPDWLRARLETLGLRAINNVVDITNYVMLASGQPLHAFDADKIRGTVQVRQANAGETFSALDGKSYTLATEDIVIADDDRVMALAGVMGGEDSGVTETTTDIILESAFFDPASIRRTSRRLGLASDSSYRFERRVNLQGVDCAGAAAARVLADLAGAQSVSITAEVCNDEALRASLTGSCPPIPLRPERVRHLLGVEISDETIAGILQRFELEKTDTGWVPPLRRPDLTREVDLIEEIARVVGMEAIPAKTHAQFAHASGTDRAYDRAMALRHALVGLGLHEARSLTLVSAEPRGATFTGISPGCFQRVKNPMIDDQVVLRPNLLPGLLEAVGRNVRAGEKSIRLFEIGRVFANTVPEESSHLALVLSGPQTGRSWRGSEGAEGDLFILKGLVATVLGGEVTFDAAENMAVALSVEIKVAGTSVGFAGQLWPADARALDATAPVLFAEIDLGALAAAEAQQASGKYQPIPRFPATSRDIALLAPLTLPHAQILSVLHTPPEPLLASVELFDVFTDPTGTRVPADQRSLAYSLTYRASDRTLTAEVVNGAHSRLKQRLTEQLPVSLRE